MTEIERAIEYLTRWLPFWKESNADGARHIEVTITALREKAEREKGCGYCTDPATINQAGRKFYKSFSFDIGSQGEICLAYDKDGWNVHFEDCDDTGVMCNAPINKCPMCGRRLEVK